jgi:cobalt/nickel transport system permease protein
VVLAVQAFIFQDGGVLALGANIFNMAIMGVLGGYFIFAGLRKVKVAYLTAAAVAAWCSVFLASFVCALELGFSGVSPFGVVLPAMLFVHSFIGLGEAFITVSVLSFIKKTRPDLLYGIENEK